MSSSILQKILDEKRREVVQAAAQTPLSALQGSAAELPPTLGFVRRLTATPFPAIIAEIKRASPSKGMIREDLDPFHTATAYATAGAACLSVLTDEQFFRGHLSYLPKIRTLVPNTPLLRKDFIVHPYQVWESRNARADALLLIMAALTDDDFDLLLGETLRAGLDALIEVHTEEELDRAAARCQAAGAAAEGRMLIGVNNRDLNVFRTDLATTKRLTDHGRKSGFIVRQTGVVAESGIHSAADVCMLQSYGATAYLIGESLVATGDPGENLNKLIAAARAQSSQERP